ncbi:MAG: nucleotide exchange factor GrpE, partial [Microcystaceae cyanobacterium]
MIDEDKQQNNTNQQSGEESEEKQAMTSDSTAQINVNASQSEGTEPVASQVDVSSDTTTQNQSNSVAATVEGVSGDFAGKEAAFNQQIESLKAQLEERSTQYMRIAADFENYRKRNQKEKEDLEQQIKRNTITVFLPFVYYFERSISQIKPQNDGEMT